MYPLVLLLELLSKWLANGENEDKVSREEVIAMAPGEAISLDHLGDIYFALKRKREAKFFWKQALDLAKPEDMIINSIKRKLKENYAG